MTIHRCGEGSKRLTGKDDITGPLSDRYGFDKMISGRMFAMKSGDWMSGELKAET